MQCILMISIVVQCIGQCIGIKLIMISIVLHYIDYNKYSCAMFWDCIAYDKLSYAIHWNSIANDKKVVQCNRIE